MITRLISAALVLVCGSCSQRQAAPEMPDADAPWADRVRAIATRAAEEQGIVGLSVAIAVDGELAFAEGFGHADAQRTVPATAGTVYDIASVGKQFTAAAVMRLAEQNMLSLDDHAREHIPELPKNFPDPTIRQLLQHTSGFVDAELDEFNPPADAASPRYGLELLSDAALTGGKTRFEEGETWVYSNASYIVLGLIVEAASGERYDRYVRDHLLEPNGLGSVFVCERADFPLMAQALNRTDEGVSEMPHIDMTYYSGSGSVCASVIDLLRWSRALRTGRVVSPASLEMMRTEATVTGSHDQARLPYGFAQRMGVLEGHPRVGHSGTFEGGSAILFEYPSDNLEIAILSNTRGSGVPHAAIIETQIAKLILGITDPDVGALAQPVPVELRRRIEGSYAADNTLAASIEGDQLVVYEEGAEIERLVHIGDAVFRDPENPDIYEWFLIDGDRAGWWAYSISGNFLDVMRRQ